MTALNLFVLREAVASTALSHPEPCKCDACKATAGDEAAFARIVGRLIGVQR